MKLVIKFFLLFVTVLITQHAYADTFKVEKPDAGVPPECAIFSEEKGWGQGKWGGGVEHELWVEKINTDCTAQVVYVWGASPNGFESPGHKRVSAVIKEGVLSLTLKEFGPKIVVFYTFKNKKDQLAGVYERTESGFVGKSKIILKRGTTP